MHEIKLTGQLPENFKETYEGDVAEVDQFFEAVYDN